MKNLGPVANEAAGRCLSQVMKVVPWERLVRSLDEQLAAEASFAALSMGPAEPASSRVELLNVLSKLTRKLNCCKGFGAEDIMDYFRLLASGRIDQKIVERWVDEGSIREKLSCDIIVAAYPALAHRVERFLGRLSASELEAGGWSRHC